MKPAAIRLSIWALLAVPAVGSAAEPKAAPTAVAPVEVAAPQTPKVVATYPANGETVPGGAVIVKIVFDQPMTPDAWSYGRSAEGDFPDCLARPRLLDDKTTVVLLCSLPVNRPFAIQINSAPDFVSSGDRAAKPYPLKFSTGPDTTAGLHDALLKAGLTDAANPIMDWTGQSGVSSALPPAPGR